MKSARLRVASVAYAEIKAKDENTALTLTALRRLINQGVIPSVPAGKKKLINMNMLEEYLANPEKYEQEESKSGLKVEV